MKELKEKLSQMKLRTNKNKLHQTDARQYKNELHNLFIEALKPLGYEITLVENGFIIEVEHEELGAVPVEAKFVIKQLDFDVMAASEQFNEKVERAKERELEKKNKRTV